MRQRPVNAKEMWEAVKNGDKLSIRVAEKFGKYLGEFGPRQYLCPNSPCLAGSRAAEYLSEKMRFMSHLI